MKKVVYTLLLTILLAATPIEIISAQGLTQADKDIQYNARRAARHDDLEMLKTLASQHPAILQNEGAVYEIFGLALYRDHYAIVDYLLPHIKNYDYVTAEGGTYLMRVVTQQNDYKYLKHFLKKSSLANYKAKDGDTAFSSAGAVYNLKAMKMLLEHGVKDLDSHTNNTAVPLNVVVAHGDTELVEIMLERGADPNHQYESFYRQFPLQIAVEKGFPEIVELLLKYKADPDKLTCYGETPLYIAEYRSNRDHIDEADTLPRKQVVSLLKKYGAKMPKNKPSSRESFGSFRRVGC